jgi:hypothetical protein
MDSAGTWAVAAVSGLALDLAGLASVPRLLDQDSVAAAAAAAAVVVVSVGRLKGKGIHCHQAVSFD